MDHDQKFCLQSLKDELDNCVDKEVDIDNGKKKQVKKSIDLQKLQLLLKKAISTKKKKSKKQKSKKKKRLSNSALPLRKLAILGASNHRQGF